MCLANRCLATRHNIIKHEKYSLVKRDVSSLPEIRPELLQEYTASYPNRRRFTVTSMKTSNPTAIYTILLYIIDTCNPVM
jgi:hypothetical protein